jgi:hypothetical protein
MTVVAYTPPMRLVIAGEMTDIDLSVIQGCGALNSMCA